MLQKKLTTRELAGKSGLSTVTINRLQNGLVDPQIGTLLRYATALGVTVKDLFEPLMTGPRVTEDDELVEAARRLLRDAAYGDMIRAFIRSLNKPH